MGDEHGMVKSNDEANKEVPWKVISAHHQFCVVKAGHYGNRLGSFSGSDKYMVVGKYRHHPHEGKADNEKHRTTWLENHPEEAKLISDYPDILEDECSDQSYKTACFVM